ncbi:MAG: hypothetical protein [Caudoviricetes sp.]|nr:MAG: hypothetical protein [Caudoviricetes sp.]
MRKPTHYLLNRRTGKKLWLYDIKQDAVHELNGEYYTTMGPAFTRILLDNTEPDYLLKKIITQLENK